MCRDTCQVPWYEAEPSVDTMQKAHLKLMKSLQMKSNQNALITKNSIEMEKTNILVVFVQDFSTI